MLAFPFSFLLLPIVVGLGVAYLSAARSSDRRLRAAIKVGALTATCTAPLLTSGPGPAQLILGLLVGYLGLRMVAASRIPGLGQARIKDLVLQLITPAGILEPSPQHIRRPVLTVLAGCAGIGACAGLLVLGNRWRLWQASQLGHFLDDQLVVLEVAVGAAGMHRLIVGVAQLLGRPVRGLLDHPLSSISLGEFWSRRWNRMVQVNLATGFYWPLARSGFPTLGLLAAFAASGAMHVVPILGAGPIGVVALPCAYVLWCFLGHGAAVLIEQRLGWHKQPIGPWARAIARTRTVLLFLALSPGLIEPFAAVANVHGRSLAPKRAQAQAETAVPGPGPTSAALDAPAVLCRRMSLVPPDRTPGPGIGATWSRPCNAWPSPRRPVPGSAQAHWHLAFAAVAIRPVRGHASPRVHRGVPEEARRSRAGSAGSRSIQDRARAAATRGCRRPAHVPLPYLPDHLDRPRVLPGMPG